VRRGEIWWAPLPEPSGSGPGFRRPLLIISANSFNENRINTVMAAVVTFNPRLSAAPGNVRLPAKGPGLTKPSVVNVSQIIAADKAFLSERLGRLSPRLLNEVEKGLRLVLSL